MISSISNIVLQIFSLPTKLYTRFMDQLYISAWPRRLGKCGRDLHIYYPCSISGAKHIEIGDNVHINRGAFIRGDGGLVIGDNVHIARNLTLYTINHNYHSGNAIPYDNTLIHKPVVIERNVWIGINVTIVPGVTIGEGAVIGAGCVVTTNVPPLSIVGTMPFRVIKKRDEAHYTKLDKLGKYGAVNGNLYVRSQK